MGGHEQAADVGKNLPRRIAHTGQESRMQVQADFALDERSARAGRWFNPASGQTIRGESLPGGRAHALGAPFAGPAVLCPRLDA